MRLLHFLIGLTTAGPVSILVGLFLFFGLAQPFWVSVGFALSSGVVVTGGVYGYFRHSFLKKHRLTRKEYTYIRKNLIEARGKIRRLQKSYINVRSISAFRQLYRVNRLVKKIYNIVKREPRRFYQAKRFFFYHLDSVIELTEKYVFLTAQSVQDKKMDTTLQETRQTIEALIQSIERDLYDLLATDLDHLEFELDVAKHSLKKWGYPGKVKEGVRENE